MNYRVLHEYWVIMEIIRSYGFEIGVALVSTKQHWLWSPVPYPFILGEMGKKVCVAFVVLSLRKS